MKSVEFLDEDAYEPTKVDFELYFDNIVGVTDYANRPVEHVEIWVAASELPYIISKPLHHTQKIVSQDDKGAIISIDVKLNYELEQTILSYGEGIEVMKPVELREKLNKRIQKLLSIYQNPEPG
uniref:helix-turn-helix transcriptional regulator n=1 Tax=Phocaeicola vulgatus TaxID=821 RepID=UPI004027B9D5